MGDNSNDTGNGEFTIALIAFLMLTGGIGYQFGAPFGFMVAGALLLWFVLRN